MIHLEITVSNTDELLATEAYGAGALLRWESSPAPTGSFTEGGTLALEIGKSLYDIWDSEGSDGVTWYRTRISDAAGSTFSAYSPILLGGVGRGLTVVRFRQRVETSLGDEALGVLLSDTYISIARVLGAPGPLTEVLTADAGDILLLSRPAESIGSVIEQNRTLDAGDYALPTPHLLIRLSTGPHPSSRWRGRPEVTYDVLGDEAERDRIALALMQLELNNHPGGLTSQRIGEWAETYATGQGQSYAEQRDAIFASYFEAGGFI